jgi:hypothetical protein
VRGPCRGLRQFRRLSSFTGDTVGVRVAERQREPNDESAEGQDEELA